MARCRSERRTGESRRYDKQKKKSCSLQLQAFFCKSPPLFTRQPLYLLTSLPNVEHYCVFHLRKNGRSISVRYADPLPIPQNVAMHEDWSPSMFAPKVQLGLAAFPTQRLLTLPSIWAPRYPKYRHEPAAFSSSAGRHKPVPRVHGAWWDLGANWTPNWPKSLSGLERSIQRPHRLQKRKSTVH